MLIVVAVRTRSPRCVSFSEVMCCLTVSSRGSSWPPTKLHCTDLQHQIWLLTLQGRLHTTPLASDLTSILDVGTGTGVWAISIARAFPQADIIATDLAIPHQNDDSPPNVCFMKHNADEREWSPFKPDQFDFIHARMITSGIHDWPSVRANCYLHLKPGGCLELLDLAHPLHAEISEFDSSDSSPLINFVRLAGVSWRRSGLDYNVTEKHPAALAAVGFADVKEETFRWPIGHWPEEERERKIGQLALENLERFLILAGKPILMNGGFMREEEAEEAVRAAKEDLLRTDEKKFYYVM